MTKLDDIKKTLPPALALLPDAPAFANEMRRHEEALALDAMKDRVTRADGPPFDISTALALTPAREYFFVLGRCGKPSHRSPPISRLAPVDCTLASAHQNDPANVAPLADLDALFAQRST